MIPLADRIKSAEKEMPATANNQNAVKDEADVASSVLHIRAVPRDKAGWVKAAKRRGQKLAAWVTEELNSASK